MTQFNLGQATANGPVTREDLHKILGDMDDATAVAILDMHPTISQVEQAYFWANGQVDMIAPEQRVPEGVVAQIFDILTADDEDERPSGH